MSIALTEKVDGIRKILKIWNRISKRMPSTYPRASLVIHLSQKELEEYFFEFYKYSKADHAYMPYSFCDANVNTIHVHATMAENTVKEIARYLLHEIAHLLAYEKYGEKDPRADDKNNKIDEMYANRFSARWIRKLCDEGWFS